jgi:uncharacterized membrane protein
MMLKRPRAAFKLRVVAIVLYTLLLATLIFFTYKDSLNQTAYEIITGALLLLYPLIMLITKKLK